MLISHCSVTSRFKNDREGFDSKVSTQTLEIIQSKYSDIDYFFSKCRYSRKSSFYQLASYIKFQIVSMDTSEKGIEIGSSSTLCPISNSKSCQWTSNVKGIETVQALHYVTAVHHYCVVFFCFFPCFFFWWCCCWCCCFAAGP